MRIRREHVLKGPRNPAEVYYTARGTARFRGVYWRTVAWGATPTKARLNLLWSMDRRRFPADKGAHAKVRTRKV